MPRYSLAPPRTNTGTIDGRAVLNAIRVDLAAEGRIELIDWLDENNRRLLQFVATEVAKLNKSSKIAQLRQIMAATILELVG